MEEINYIMSIDCSLNNVGVTVWNAEESHPLKLFLLRNVKILNKLKGEERIEKIQEIYKFVCELIDVYNPLYIAIEAPTGSQSSSAMVSYTVELSLIAFLRNLRGDDNVIVVSPLEAKKALTGNKNAKKDEMIQKAFEKYPTLNWVMKNGKLVTYMEHCADSLAVGLAGFKFEIINEK